ncbi:MAG: hypothetical protein MJ124_07370 [Lachnospiraceae bacterium]|nr:hypothetical protein [Lachnospiraceae bacterium]
MTKVERLIRMYHLFDSKPGEYHSSTALLKEYKLKDKKAIYDSVDSLKDIGCVFDNSTKKGIKMTSGVAPTDWAMQGLPISYREAVETIRESCQKNESVETFLNYALESIAYRKIAEGELKTINSEE